MNETIFQAYGFFKVIHDMKTHEGIICLQPQHLQPPVFDVGLFSVTIDNDLLNSCKTSPGIFIGLQSWSV